MGPQRYFLLKSCHKWDHNDIFPKTPVINVTTKLFFDPKQRQKLWNEGLSPLLIGKFLIFQKLYLKHWIKKALLWSLGAQIVHFLHELLGYSVIDGITTIFYEKIMSSMRPQRYFLGKFSHRTNIYTTICL